MADLIWEIRDDETHMVVTDGDSPPTTRYIEAEFPTAVTAIETPLVRYTHFECLGGDPEATYPDDWIDVSEHMECAVSVQNAQSAIIEVKLWQQSRVDPNQYIGLSAAVRIRYLLLNGTLIGQGYTKILSVQDDTSINKFGKRTLDLRAKLALPENIALSMINNALAYYKDPQPKVDMEIAGKDDTLLTQILTRHLSDRITVQNTRLSLDSDFFIDKEMHQIEQGGLHIVNYKLGKVVTGQMQAQVDTSKVDECVVTY